MNMEQLVQNNFPRKKVGLYELFTVININSFFNGGLPQTRTFSEEVIFHDFWEFYYVDRGTLSIELEEKSVFLEAGEGIFYSPYSKHRLTGSDSESVNIISLAFDCVNLDTDFFSNTVFALNSLEKSILSKII